MNDVLLKTLTSSDIEWIKSVGQRQDLFAGEILTTGELEQSLFIILEGELAGFEPRAEDDVLGRAFAAIEETDALLQEVVRFSRGEMVGEVPGITVSSGGQQIKAIVPSMVLSIARELLEENLRENVGFASRFYRSVAICMADKFQGALDQAGQRKLSLERSVRDVLYVLSGLNDLDLDWLMSCGRVQKVAAGQILIHEKASVDALYILLDGMMSLSRMEDEHNPLLRAFAAIEKRERMGTEFTRISRGELVGETILLDDRLSSATVTALIDTTVLTISRQVILTKIRQDIGFAVRFYRAIATLLFQRWQSILIRLRYGYRRGISPLEGNNYQNALDLPTMDQMERAGRRFELILKESRVLELYGV